MVKGGLWGCPSFRVDVNSLPQPLLENLATGPGQVSVLVLVQRLRRKGDSRSWGQHMSPAIVSFGSCRSATVFAMVSAIRFALSSLLHRIPLGEADPNRPNTEPHRPTKKPRGLGPGASVRDFLWLPCLRTYRTRCLAPGAEFRLLLEEAREIRFAA